ncbi:MAG TPA: aspartate aminotransferase family protein [Dermatophilaceae bacterium]|nr:aspartate aminotransferase family protein [Dermatophilaceae bacterium]
MTTTMTAPGSIDEAALAELNFPDAPLMRTSVPGPEGVAWMARAAEVESMARGAGRFPLVFAAGRGSTVKDVDGNTLIDLAAGVAVSSVGRLHPRVTSAMKAQIDELMHAADLSSVRRTELAEKVASIMPPGLRDNCITYFTQGGSGAIETALKFVRTITGRSQIVAFHGAYHGVWTSSGSLTTGEKYHQGNLHIPDVIHVPYPYGYRCPLGGVDQQDSEQRCATYLDYVLNTPYTGADDVAAVIMEPIQGEGGYIAASPWFMERVKEICEKAGALYISDEVQAGAGRSGTMWVIEQSSVEPDVLIWGKGMGGDVAMAGCTFRKDLALKVAEGTQPNTFSANGLSAVATMTNIDILTENDAALLRRVAEVGEETQAYLREAAQASRYIGDVRGRGLMIGIELVADKQTKEPLDADAVGMLVGSMLQKGVILIPCGRYGTVLRLMPPLTITRELLRAGCNALLESVRELEATRS